MMVQVPFHLLAALAVVGAYGESAESDAIIFPSINSVPPRISTQQSFAKAAKTIHYAAARLLDWPSDAENSNWVVSPISLAAVLGQLMLGARGDFHRILGEILSPVTNESEIFPGLEVHKELGGLLGLLHDDVWADYLLYINSALFIDPTIQLKLAYKHALSDIYNVNIFRTNFSGNPKDSMDQVNAWAHKATFGRITEILGEPVPPSTASLYLNTVYFKGVWKHPFDPLLTKPGLFNTNSTHQVRVDFMASEVEVKYHEDQSKKCTMVGIPYISSSIFLYIFIPDKEKSGSHYRLTEFASGLTADHMTEMIDQAELQNVTLIFPKISLSSTLSLRKPMVRAIKRRTQALRASNIIRDDEREMEQDLSTFLSNSYVPQPLPLRVDNGPLGKYRLTFNMGSASDDYRFKINDVLHKVQLEINEKGSEAVAVSTTLVDYIGSIIVKVNRPFLFLIRHEYTGAHLFWGGIQNPENQGEES